MAARKTDSPSRPARQGEPPSVLLERALFVIETAEAHGVSFAIEDGKLAVLFPLDIHPRFWRELQRAILTNKQTIAELVYNRDLGAI